MKLKSLLATLALTTALTLPGLAMARPVSLTTTLNNYDGDGAYLALYVTDASGVGLDALTAGDMVMGGGGGGTCCCCSMILCVKRVGWAIDDCCGIASWDLTAGGGLLRIVALKLDTFSERGRTEVTELSALLDGDSDTAYDDNVLSE